MPRLDFFTVCCSASRANATKQVFRAHTLTDFFPATFPDVLARSAVISSWRLTRREMRQDWVATLVIKPPGRTETFFPMNLSNSLRRSPHVREIMAIPLSEPGPLLFELLLDGKSVASHVVTIHAPWPCAANGTSLNSAAKVQTQVREHFTDSQASEHSST
jgi:hypothetical protein